MPSQMTKYISISGPSCQIYKKQIGSEQLALNITRNQSNVLDLGLETMPFGAT